MTQREKKGRRRSSLSGMSPIATPVTEQPAKDPVKASAEVEVPQQPEESPTAADAPKKAPQAAPKAPKKKKVSFYLSPEEEARAEAARIFTAGHTGLKTVTSYYEQAIAEFTRKLEAEYNDSKPFG